jgi:hypothetical protein
MLNWKGFGTKRSLPILRHYPGIRLEGLRKTTTNLCTVPHSRGNLSEILMFVLPFLRLMRKQLVAGLSPRRPGFAPEFVDL